MHLLLSAQLIGYFKSILVEFERKILCFNFAIALKIIDQPQLIFESMAPWNKLISGICCSRKIWLCDYAMFGADLLKIFSWSLEWKWFPPLVMCLTGGVTVWRTVKSESFWDYEHIKFIVLNSLNSLVTFVDIYHFFMLALVWNSWLVMKLLCHKIENTPAQVKLYNYFAFWVVWLMTISVSFFVLWRKVQNSVLLILSMVRMDLETKTSLHQ